MEADLDVDITHADAQAVVRRIGNLDPATASQLRTEFIDLVGQGVRKVTGDLGGLDFIASTGPGVLVGGLKRLREHGGRLGASVPQRERPEGLRDHRPGQALRHQMMTTESHKKMLRPTAGITGSEPADWSNDQPAKAE